MRFFLSITTELWQWQSVIARHVIVVLVEDAMIILAFHNALVAEGVCQIRFLGMKYNRVGLRTRFIIFMVDL